MCANIVDDTFLSLVAEDLEVVDVLLILLDHPDLLSTLFLTHQHTVPSVLLPDTLSYTALIAIILLFDPPHPIPHPHPPVSANYSTLPSVPDDTLWYPDTGATHHITSDFSKLNLHSDPYAGNDSVIIGDGAPLAIAHTGSGHLSTTHGKYLLTNLLHVPLISKNLLSVHQFCLDNNVFFEFHAHSFFVKDALTRQTLLHGPSHNRLYPIHGLRPPSSSLISAHLGVRTSFDQWHNRLGHPAPRVVQRVLSSNSLPVSAPTVPSHCSACRTSKSHRLPSPSSPH